MDSSLHAGLPNRLVARPSAGRGAGVASAGGESPATRLQRQRDALVRLTVETAASGADHGAALALITEIAARTLNVERTSVWRYDEDRGSIRCVDLFERRDGRHSEGEVLERANVPRYFEVLEQSDVIAAHDARADLRTSEFGESYLVPLGITSMLDATIRLGGRVDGVLCHEHVGPMRLWEPDEESFAVSVANIVALVLERWERSLVEQRLRERERMLAEAEQIARLGSWEMEIRDPGHLELNRVSWSEELFRLLGRKPGEVEVSAETFFSFLHPDDREKTVAALRETLHAKRPYNVQHRIVRPDGTVRILQQRGHLIAGDSAGTMRLVGAAQDVTEIELTIRALERSREEFRLLFASNPMSMWVYDPDTLRFLAVNRAAVARYGYTEDEFLGMTLLDIRPVEDIPEFIEVRATCGPTLERGVWRHRTKAGRELSVRISTHPIQYHGRDAELVLAEDVTAAETAMAALRESEERFRQMADNIEAVVWMNDVATDSLLYVSRGFERIWGIPCDELKTNPRGWLDVVVPADRERVIAALAGRGSGDYNIEYRIARPDGDVRWIADRAFPVRDLRGVPYRVVGVARDITDTKRLQEQFLRSQRMEAVGTLAGGVAHDLNNILAPILMVGGILREKLTDPNDLTMVRMVEKSAQRGAGIVSQLLTFSRGLGGERVPLQAEMLVKEIRHLLTETLPRNIEIAIETEANLPGICADATQVHQVLMNLAVNARDAMPHGGRLVFGVGRVHVSENEAFRHCGAKAGEHVRISVSDTGSGISPEVMQRMFDPFFTTKELGKGTGLGLSTVVGIVRGHEGFVSVQSELGKGTRFDVHFPAVPSVDPGLKTTTPMPPRSPRNETVLVVDDEDTVRQAARAVLEVGGYRVLEAAGVQQALELLEQRRAEVRAVLTDVMMPGIDGWTLARTLRERSPDLPVIVCSGLDGQGVGTEPADVPVAAVIAKPFSAVALLETFHRVLK